MSKPIEDYGIIGNMNSAALVARNGSIDWLCVPRFDSPACFAALLGTSHNGRWLIAPRHEHRQTRRYIPGTAVLETTFETATGSVRITDFMPMTEDEERVDVVRMVHGESGEVAMHMELIVRFTYGQAVPWVQRRDYGLSAVAGADALELHTPIPLSGRDMRTVSEFTVRKGDTVPFTLSYHRSYKQPHFIPDRRQALDETTQWWCEWSGHCTFPRDNPAWHEAVVRSLITLKLLTFRPTGGIVAAPTTSLPESVGGPRNWDYRYCWLRDSALTLYALLNAGYRDEAKAWRQWALRAVAGQPTQLRIMYGIRGERWLPENEIPWLPGYMDSKPVRVGNGAVDQLQLDVYGEVSDTLHAARAADLAPTAAAGDLQLVLMQHLESIWREQDHGIWEMRGPTRDFTYSKIMCWVAFDRAVKAAKILDHGAMVDRWKAVRDEIRREVCEKGFDPERNTFTQYYGSRALDASLLLVPQLGFLDPHDPRMLGTVAAVEEDLLHKGFVLRYRTDHVDDGLEGSEGAFLACSFWLADAHVVTGRIDKGREMFERLLGIRNDLGLLAEEYDPVRKRLLGNYPQAFSHIGLINTAHNLAATLHPAEQRARGEAPRRVEATNPR